MSDDAATDLVLETGFSKPLKDMTLANRKELISVLTLYHLMIKVKSSVDQFIDGLDDVQLLSAMRKYPDTWEVFFVNLNTTITPGSLLIFAMVLSNDLLFISDKLKSLFTVLYSVEGSRAKQIEVDTYVFFGDFLDECDGRSLC